MPPHQSSSSSTKSAIKASPFFRPSNTNTCSNQKGGSRFVRTPGGTTRRRRMRQGEPKEAGAAANSDNDEHKSTVLGCASNLVNAIVGAGIAGLPFALQESGLVPGIILVLVCALLTEKSLRLLIETAKHANVPSYETVAEAAYGSLGFWFVASNMFIMSYGGMLSYLMIVKDTFSSILGIDDVARKRAVLVIISFLIILPLSCQRDMADLAKTSTLNVCFDLLMVLLVAYLAFHHSDYDENFFINNEIDIDSFANTDPYDIWSIRWNTIFVGLGVLSFAFVCQHSSFIIAGSLDRPTKERWSTVTKLGLGLAACLALVMGISGYLGFGGAYGAVKGNILNNLPENSGFAQLARGLLGITMLFVYPMESFVARHACVVLLFEGRRAHEGDDASVLNRRDRRITLTVALYFSALIPAAYFDQLGDVLAITGAIGGSCLSYIGPGLVYLGIHGGRFLELSNAWFGREFCDNKGSNDLQSATTTSVSDGPLSQQNNLKMISSNGMKNLNHSPATKAPIRVVTFDLDNTLWKTWPTISAANEALADYLSAKTNDNGDPLKLPKPIWEIMGDLFRANRRKYCPLVGDSMPIPVSNDTKDTDTDELLERTLKSPVMLTQLRIDALCSVLEIENDFTVEDALNVAEDAFDVWTKARHNAILTHLAPRVVETLNDIRTTITSSVGSDDVPVLMGAITDGNSDPRKIAILAPYFDFCVNAESVGVSKPDKRVFLQAVRQAIMQRPELFSDMLQLDGKTIGKDCNLVESFNNETLESIVGPYWCHIGDDFRKDIKGAKDMKMRTIFAIGLVKDALLDSATKPADSGNDMTELLTQLSSRSGTDIDDYIQSVDAVAQEFSDVGNILIKWHNEAVDAVTTSNNCCTERNRGNMNSRLYKLWKTFLWYGTGMPLWIRLASIGKETLTTYVTEMALKSPHPIRIGNVRFSRAKIQEDDSYMLPKNQRSYLGNNNSRGSKNLSLPMAGAVDSEGENDDRFDSLTTKLLRTDSLPKLSKYNSDVYSMQSTQNRAIVALPPLALYQTTSSSGGAFQHTNQNYQSITQTIGAMVMAEQAAEHVLEDDIAIEDDPQGDPPTVLDFIVAISYIVFGAVAMFAGLVSIFL